MYDEGYLQIWNNDISPSVISQMKEKNRLIRPQLQYDVMDVLAMTYDDNMFDLIVDKSTMDVFICGHEASSSIETMLKECYRVLKSKGGFYVCISFAEPKDREKHLTSYGLDWKVQKFEIKKKLNIPG